MVVCVVDCRNQAVTKPLPSRYQADGKRYWFKAKHGKPPIVFSAGVGKVTYS